MGQTLPTNLLHTQIHAVDVSVTRTGMLLTPTQPWEKNTKEIQKCWPRLPSSQSAHTGPAVALPCSLPSPLSLTPLTEKQTHAGGCGIPGCCLCPRASSRCPSLPFCIRGVSSVCKLFGAATARLCMALMDTVLGRPQGTIRINVNNNNSDKQRQL